MKRMVLFAAVLLCAPGLVLGQEPKGGALQENGVGFGIRMADGREGWRAHSAIYEKDGRYFIQGIPGAAFGLCLHGAPNRRYEFVISIDGVSVMTGESSSGKEEGYVVTKSAIIPGWRRDNETAARFEFIKERLSYATLTDRPENVGVIGVRVYAEAGAAPIVAYKPAPGGVQPRKLEGHDLGTIDGDEIRHPVRGTQFRRGECVAELRLEYASGEALRAAGIIPPAREMEEVDAFPARGPSVPPSPGWRGRRR